MKLLIALALVALVYGKEGSGGGNHDKEDEDWMVPEPCCFPDLWAGEQITMTTYKDNYGNHAESKNVMKFYMDFAAGKMSGDEEIIRDGETVANFSFVTDFNKQYNKLYERKSKECSWYKVPSPFFRQCINKKAKFVETTHIGVGDSKVSINIFQDKYEEDGNEMKMMVGVTPGKCVPVFIKVEGELMDGKMEFKRESKYYGNMDDFETDGLFDYKKKLHKCTEFEETDTPDAIKGLAHIADVFFPKTSPRKCCFPDTWEGKTSYVRGYTEGSTTRMLNIHTQHFAVDYKNKRFFSADRVFLDDVSTHNLTYIGNLQYGTLYAINMNTKNCSRYNIPSVSKMSSQCISSQATFLGMPTLGLMEGGLQTSSWRMYQPELEASIDLTVAQQDGKCVPVSTVEMGNDFMGLTAFYDLKAEITKEEIFNPPSTCNGIEAEDMPAEIENIIGDVISILSSP